MNIEKEVQKALMEIGEIKPWFSDEYGFYVFKHPTYPVVDYVGDTPEETIEGYKRILKEWIQERINQNIPDFVEKMTSGRGGARPGAGRPKKEETTQIRIPTDIATWLRADPSRYHKIRELMETKTNIDESKLALS